MENWFIFITEEGLEEAEPLGHRLASRRAFHGSDARGRAGSEPQLLPPQHVNPTLQQTPKLPDPGCLNPSMDGAKPKTEKWMGVKLWSSSPRSPRPLPVHHHTGPSLATLHGMNNTNKKKNVEKAADSPHRSQRVGRRPQFVSPPPTCHETRDRIPALSEGLNRGGGPVSPKTRVPQSM